MAARLRWGLAAGMVCTGLGIAIGRLRARHRALDAPAYDSAGVRVLILGGGFGGLTTARSKPVAPTAQAAVQEAVVVANNLFAEVTGGETEPFEYHFMGQLVTLGGQFAVSQVFGGRLSGWAGHLLRRGVYLYKLGDWRDRLHVVSDWSVRACAGASVPRLRLQ